MIDHPLEQYTDPLDGPPIEVDVADEAPEDDASVLLGEDGQPIDDPESAPNHDDIEHYDNLAKHLSDSALTLLGQEIKESFDEDKASRKDWEQMFEAGLDLLGIKNEDRVKPWPGAAGMYHPMLSKAVVRFQSNAIMEIFPEAGPVKVKLMGKISDDKIKQGDRVKDYFNHLLVDKMEDYRRETERLLFSLALCGSAFRKVYPDPLPADQPCATFVPAQDFVMPWGAGSLRKAPRYTEIKKITRNELKQKQVSEFYLDTDLGDPVDITLGPTQDKIDKVNKETKNALESDYYTFLEMHVDLDLAGFEDESGVMLPYVVTVDYNTSNVLSVYRNWEEGDPAKAKLIWYAHYDYIPGLGSYGYGLIHLMGAVAKGATSILRQLIDAGTLANLPGGFKTKGLRVKNDGEPIGPGQFKDVDVPAGKIQDNIMALPFKSPDPVLLQLMGILVEEGEDIGSMADANIDNIGSQTPVGTILAVLERNLKVMSAVQARLHASMHDEFRILRRVVKEIVKAAPGEQYEYDVEGGSRSIMASDFSDKVDVIPVSNPNAATMAQQLVQYQMLVQLMPTAPPGTYDIPAAHRAVLASAGIRDIDRLIPDNSQTARMDPATENAFLITGKPVKVFEDQDHDSHIKVHSAFAQDPMVAKEMGQNPQAQGLFASVQSHITEHIALAYRVALMKKLGVPLPGLGESLPADTETSLSLAVADAAQQLLSEDQQRAAQEQAQQVAQDPVIQLQQQELQIKAQAVQQKAQDSQGKLQLAAQQLQADASNRKMEIVAKHTDQQAKLQEDAQEHYENLRLELKRLTLESQQARVQEMETQAKIAQQEREMQAGLAETQARIALMFAQIEELKKRPHGSD
jgi:hypothetical protein